jgi:CheY-like chemotaxis protein
MQESSLNGVEPNQSPRGRAAILVRLQGMILISDSQSSHITMAPTNILLVEDNKIDARLMRHAFQNIANWPSSIHVVDDGEKAIKFLRRESVYEEAVKPDLIVLDLNLPKYDGTEVLKMIRASEDLRHLLVFIFSSSPVDIAEDRVESADVKADRYFEKPNEVGTYLAIATQIGEDYRRATLERLSASA